MINKEVVTSIILDKIRDTDIFIVEVNVRPGNAIDVTMDGDSGITIETCMEIHRHLLHEMDREVEDYSLEVSSPDLDKPLKVLRQYAKNIGRTLEVKKIDNSKVEGILTNAGEHGIVLLSKTREAVEGKKTKQWVERDVEVSFDAIKETKIVISFK